MKSALEGLRSVGEEDAGVLEHLLDYEVRFESVDSRIKQLVSRLPKEGEDEKRRREGIVKEELETQARAAELKRFS